MILNHTGNLPFIIYQCHAFFFAFFTVLLIIVTFGLDNITFRLLILFPLVLAINLCLGLVNRVSLEKSNIQKGDPDE